MCAYHQNVLNRWRDHWRHEPKRAYRERRTQIRKACPTCRKEAA